ncbi:hypothetical protein BDN70DRAFT_813382 [Pholiota conissans]|uniref:Oxidase ustYa n=1 Tax=Pholiota conissans TaxID=109636 RepID=A0A9P5YVC5_9AGAR|nr:hypothetical protein BDN70DRAFT_813382 [Pholiota conissans]
MKPNSQWKLVLSLVILALYQTLDFGMKLHTLRQLCPIIRPETVEYSFIGHDRPNALPLHVKHTAMNAEWLDDRVYGIYADDDWASLIPPDSGFVDLGPNHDMFSLSMYHQLHCLDVLRYGFASAKAGALVYPGNGTSVDHHVSHCLVYLREMILCAADTMLEPADTIVLDKEGKEHLGSTGGNVVHRCRDWTQVRDMVEANTAECMIRLREERRE